MGWIAAWTVAALLGCSDTGTEPKPTGSTGITVSPKQLSLVVGGTATLEATVHDAHGNEVRGATVFWSTADATIATVSGEGVVRALKTGTVKIAASSGGSSDLATVVVGQQPVTSISITPVSATVTAGGTTQLTVALAGPSGEPLTDRVVTWRSSNESVLTVDANGRVAALAPGAASVTATSEGRSTSAAITVVPVAIGGVSVSPSSVSLTVGQTTQLGVAVTDVNGQPLTDRDVRWSSSDERVATVSSSGLAIALAVGSATITATVEGKSAPVAVTVSPVPVGAVVVSPSPAQLFVGQSVTLGVQITDATGRPVNRDKTFSSDAPQIASVDQQGVVRGVSPGTTTVRVRSEGQEGTTTVIVARVPVASVTVSPASASLLVGRSTTLTATARDASGNVLGGREVSWRSSNESVATVSQSGVVSAVGAGSAVIFATSEGRTDQATVTVSPVPVASVSVAPSSSAIVVGQTTTLVATVVDEDGRAVSDRAVTWTTSDARVALVSSNGLVTAVGAGTVTITATSEGRSGSASVTIAPVPVASVVVSPPSSSVTVGATVQLSAAAKDASGNTLSDRAVSWSSSDPGVATVSGTGLVTALKAGSATITATSEGRSGTASVSVSPVPVASVDVAPSTASLQVGQTRQLTATPKDASGNALPGRAVAWSSAQPGIADVDQNGVVRAVSAGTATITATSEGKTGTASITVTPVPVASVAVTPPNQSVVVGATVQLAAEPRDASGNALTDRPVSWSSSDERVVTVSSGGLAIALSVGSATITATSEGKSGTATIVVSAVRVASVDVTPSPTSVQAGQTRQLTATPRDAGGNPLSGRTVSWSSSDNGVATVSSSGVVTGVAPGGAIITATSDGVSGSSSVTVTPVPVASVSVSPPSASMSVGGSVRLEATPRDASGSPLSGRQVTWSSNHPEIADVDQNGNVTGIAPGSATITATSEGRSGTASITITPPPVASVTVTPQPAALKPGNAITLTATCRDADGEPVSGVPVGWAMTTSTSIATFLPVSDVSIRVAAKKKGTARFTASCGTKSTQASVDID